MNFDSEEQDEIEVQEYEFTNTDEQQFEENVEEKGSPIESDIDPEANKENVDWNQHSQEEQTEK